MISNGIRIKKKNILVKNNKENIKPNSIDFQLKNVKIGNENLFKPVVLGSRKSTSSNITSQNSNDENQNILNTNSTKVTIQLNKSSQNYQMHPKSSIPPLLREKRSCNSLVDYLDTIRHRKANKGKVNSVIWA